MESPNFWVLDLSPSADEVNTRVDGVKRRMPTRLNGTSNLVASTRDVLSDLVGGGLLRVWSNLLLGLLAESLAPERDQYLSRKMGKSWKPYIESDMMIDLSV